MLARRQQQAHLRKTPQEFYAMYALHSQTHGRRGFRPDYKEDREDGVYYLEKVGNFTCYAIVAHCVEGFIGVSFLCILHNAQRPRSV